MHAPSEKISCHYLFTFISNNCRSGVTATEGRPPRLHEKMAIYCFCLRDLH